MKKLSQLIEEKLNPPDVPNIVKLALFNSGIGISSPVDREIIEAYIKQLQAEISKLREESDGEDR